MKIGWACSFVEVFGMHINIGWAYVKSVVVIVVKPRNGDTEQEAQIKDGPSLP